jgi:hypothetical protein
MAVDIVGFIDAVDENQQILGWAVDKGLPSKRLEVLLLEGDVVVSNTIADVFRPDVAAAGHGDGSCGFILEIPPMLLDGSSYNLRVFAGHSAHKLLIGELKLPARLRPESEPSLAAEPEIIGFIDRLYSNWRITGWAFDRSSPSTRLEVRLLDGDFVLARTIASISRPDVAAAGFGDGYYGFVLEIPGAIFDGSSHRLSIYAGPARNARLIGEPFDLILSATLKYRKGPHQHALELFHLVTNDPANSLSNEQFSQDLADVAERLTDQYGLSVSLDLVYVHLLRRRIDVHGLNERTSFLQQNPNSYVAVIQEIMGSDEFRQLNKTNSVATLAPLTMLTAWLDSALVLRPDTV